MCEYIEMTYVLSLENATQKQEEISKHLKNLNLPFEIICFKPIQC